MHLRQVTAGLARYKLATAGPQSENGPHTDISDGYHAAMTPNQAAEPSPDRRPRMPRAARREQLLAIAQHLFASQGYHHVAMDDIAEAAQVTKPVLYRLFPSKLDLYLAVVDLRGAALLEVVDEVVTAGKQTPGDLSTLIGAVVMAYVDFVETAGESSVLLFESDVRHDAAVRERVERAESAVRDRLSDALRLQLDPQQALIVATTVTASAQAAAVLQLRGSAKSREETIDLVTALLWGGVAGLPHTAT